MITPESSHPWTFFRTGGIDQVALKTSADLLNLEHLDQKLWVALSCPVKGLEIDEKTLALIDADGDGRIRVPELLAAVKWTATRLNNPSDLLAGNDNLAIDAINTSAPGGSILQGSARQILRSLGKETDSALTTADAANTAAIFAASVLNGSGIIPPEATEDPAIQILIKDIITCSGGTAARSGVLGITSAQIDTFFADLNAYTAWLEQSGTKDIAVLGDATAAACNAIKAVRAKVEDYFARCRMAAFDQRAIAALNARDAKKCLTALAAAAQERPLESQYQGLLSQCTMLDGRCEEGKRLFAAYAAQTYADPAIARYPLDAIVEAVAIFGGRQQVKSLPDTADVRYLLGITSNIAKDREASAITDALWEERVRAKDHILRHLERQRESIATNTPHPNDLIAAYIDCAVTAPWQSERAFWLRAAATVIKSTPSEDHLHLYRRAARRVQATYSLPNRERQAAIQTLAALLQPLR